MGTQKQSNEMVQVNTEQASRIAVKMMLKKRNLLFTGAPGVGKTCIIEQAAEKAEMNLIVFHPVISDPTDFKGMPAILKNENSEMNFLAKFVPFENLKRLLTADTPTVAFADDLGQAPPMVQAAWMQLVLARKLDDKVVSEHITFVSASNRKEDKAGVSGILEPLKSRFHTILELVVDHEIWLKWARSPEAGIHPYVRAFIRWRGGQSLYNFVASNDMTNSPNPRTVEHVSDIIWDGHDEDVRPAVLAGAVGSGFATEFESFIRIVKELPKMKAILKHPDRCPVPSNDNVSAQYAIMEAMLDQVNPKIVKPFLVYISRFKKEFQQWFTTQLKEHKPECVNTEAFTTWAAEFGIS